jgi:hypothetical protein
MNLFLMKTSNFNFMKHVKICLFFLLLIMAGRSYATTVQTVDLTTGTTATGKIADNVVDSDWTVSYSGITPVTFGPTYAITWHDWYNLYAEPACGKWISCEPLPNIAPNSNNTHEANSNTGTYYTFRRTFNKITTCEVLSAQIDLDFYSADNRITAIKVNGTLVHPFPFMNEPAFNNSSYNPYLHLSIPVTTSLIVNGINTIDFILENDLDPMNGGNSINGLILCGSFQATYDQLNSAGLNLTGPSTICQNQTATFNGSYLYSTTLSSHTWTIQQCTPGGVPNNPFNVWNSGTISGYPGFYNLTALNTMPCGHYYLVTLTVNNGCSSAQKSKIIYVNCVPVVDIGTDQHICLGDCITLKVKGKSINKMLVNWSIYGDEPTPIGSGSQITVCPTHTTTYCATVTDPATGCSGSACVTIYVESVDPSFILNSNPSLPAYLQLTGIPLQTTSLPLGFQYIWTVQEIDASNNPLWTVTSYDMANTTTSAPIGCWWSLPSSEVFDGLDATAAALPVLNPLGCSPGIGKFKYASSTTHLPKYRITYGVWSDECPWKQMVQEIYCIPPTTAGGVFEPGVATVTEIANAPDMSYLMNGHKSPKNSVIDNSPNAGILSNGIKLYPNPAENMVKVEYALTNSTTSKINVTDVTGRILKSINLAYGTSVTQIDLNEMSSGTYLINLMESGVLKSSEKLIINK